MPSDVSGALGWGAPSMGPPHSGCTSDRRAAVRPSFSPPRACLAGSVVRQWPVIWRPKRRAGLIDFVARHQVRICPGTHPKGAEGANTLHPRSVVITDARPGLALICRVDKYPSATGTVTP